MHLLLCENEKCSGTNWHGVENAFLHYLPPLSSFHIFCFIFNPCFSVLCCPRIVIVRLWTCVGRLLSSGKTDEALAAFSVLIKECTNSSTVRLGDVLAVLVRHYASQAQWKLVSHLGSATWSFLTLITIIVHWGLNNRSDSVPKFSQIFLIRRPTLPEISWIFIHNCLSNPISCLNMLKNGTRKMAIANKTCVSGKKGEAWRYVVEAFYLYAKLIYASILCLHETQEIIITKGGCLPTHLHKCCQNILRIFGLLIYSPGVRVSLCKPNNVEFSRHAEKSVSNELSTAICTFWPPLVTPLGQSR